MSKFVPVASSRTILIDGIRTHYLEFGDGPPLVLLHDGSYGSSAELSWYPNVEALGQSHRVIAPDWLGFGGTDKVHDFGGGRARRLWHMSRFLEVMDLGPAVFCGVSMGATLLLSVAAGSEYAWPIKAIVSVSGGGFIPLNSARAATLDYDCTYEGMRKIVSHFVFNQDLLDDERLVKARYEAAIEPGAWEAVAAARFKAPTVSERADFGQQDTIPYERIDVPTLLVAGANDELREPGYADELRERIPDCALLTLDNCGHLPQIEYPDRFNDTVAAFCAR
ncbi:MULTISPECIES: alpha/beta fold hydrolase [unclassified Rhodococcus (in: high G+C Gram-positive bacteria)]|uniref:alpha/beta fold hydrolase n=1 Tax=unclassified Rhodococcus (in: high G+C Gram-positive bacteria) TaxID=192944 RepID=UPI00163A171C|nr:MULTISPECIES: alpha/beta hydrolase [unclassified Rhodococcus (in: high G+C Gram-positive bacteria)]MBC2637752.1 alpha/beta hydrolase [Rhodococcus sp. 3A]MBC2897503.1 alpha/beta hydrolase [Rhodococcus sp. 4CII]